MQTKSLNIFAVEQMVSNRVNSSLFVASGGGLTQAPQPLAPSPEGEGEEGIWQLKMVPFREMLLCAQMQ